MFRHINDENEGFTSKYIGLWPGPHEQIWMDVQKGNVDFQNTLSAWDILNVISSPVTQ